MSLPELVGHGSAGPAPEHVAEDAATAEPFAHQGVGEEHGIGEFVAVGPDDGEAEPVVRAPERRGDQRERPGQHRVGLGQVAVRAGGDRGVVRGGDVNARDARPARHGGPPEPARSRATSAARPGAW